MGARCPGRERRDARLGVVGTPARWVLTGRRDRQRPEFGVSLEDASPQGSAPPALSDGIPEGDRRPFARSGTERRPPRASESLQPGRTCIRAGRMQLSLVPLWRAPTGTAGEGARGSRGFGQVQTVAIRFLRRTSTPIPLVADSQPPKALAADRSSNCSFV